MANQFVAAEEQPDEQQISEKGVTEEGDGERETLDQTGPSLWIDHSGKPDTDI